MQYKLNLESSNVASQKVKNYVFEAVHIVKLLFETTFQKRFQSISQNLDFILFVTVSTAKKLHPVLVRMGSKSDFGWQWNAAILHSL